MNSIMIRLKSSFSWLALVVIGAVLALPAPARAVNYTWTNTVSDASGYWTNGVLWGQLVTTYPSGGISSDEAYLTNQFAGTYTNILDSRLNFAVSNLAISNALGEAWLIVTNGAVNPTVLTNNSFRLSSGGRLQIDNGGVVTGMTTLSWVGGSGAIHLNNGGKLFTSGNHIIGAGGSVTGLVTSSSGAGNGGVWNRNGGALTIGGASGHENVLSITGGAVVTNVGALTITGNRNSLLASDGGAVFGAGALTFAATAGQFGNTVELGNGTWNLNNTALNVGSVANASNNTFTSFGTVTGATALSVGLVAGANFNTVIITNGGFFMTAPGTIAIGSLANGNIGGHANTVILSNSVLVGTGGGTPASIGSGSTNNTVTLLGGTVWNNNNGTLNVGGQSGGFGFAGSNNVLTVSGALLTNFGLVNVGGRALSADNQLIIENGSVLSNFYTLSVGFGTGANNNSVLVTNGGQLFMTNGAVYVGSAAAAAGGNNNTVILSDSVLAGNLASYVGIGSTNNTLTLRDSVWNLRSFGLTIGSLAGFNNVVTLTDSVMSNIGVLIISGSLGSSSNRIVVNSGILSNVTGLVVGGSAAGVSVLGANDNSLIVTSSGSGFFMTSAGTINVGGVNNATPGGSLNTVILSNSVLIGSLPANGGASIGNGSSNNILTLLANSVWNNNGGTLNVGGNSGGAGLAGTNNLLTLNGALLTNMSLLSIGGRAFASGNQVVVENGAIISNSTAVVVGSGTGGNGNSLLVTNGSHVLSVGALTVGATASANNNSVLIKDGSYLEANTITIAASTTGNTISNRNATYQFTAAPAITSQAPGDIALTDGTLSFRATGVANVATNYRIAFAGANTFQLNNASNSAATVSQTYTFDTIAGNPTNYVNLVMVNGTTAYRNANGAEITIGSAGTFLASNTVATISGNFTNNGLAAIVEATVDFQNALDVGGTLTLRNGFAIGAGVKTVAGTLRGNGSVVGDATITGDLSPGLSLGTLVFSNNLTLTGSYQAEFGDGGNDQLVVVGDLTLSGATLDLTAVGGVTGEAYVIASYGDLFGTFSVTNGMPVGYMVDYNYNGANQIAIVVVPEPSSIALVVGGLLLLGLLRRRLIHL
ncbi:MAG: hypothetical protein PCFJNLEI_00972 [Verrucomicrobiae bacterium]|nr:hypothetical protein [Verrucomicrobiae bacterium]